MAVKENAHFYYPTGEWAEFVEGASGKPVKPDPRHAQKLDLYVGCTGPLQLLNKGMLNDWAEREVIRHAQEILADGDISPLDPELTKLAQRRKADALAETAKRGSMIHGTVECAINGETLPYSGKHEAWVDTAWSELLWVHSSRDRWVSEVTFACHEYRFGGKTDVLCRGPEFVLAVGDLKTRDFTAEDVDTAQAKRDKGNKGLGKLTPRETEPMQIAANIIGQGGLLGSTKGFNTYLDRTNPKLAWTIVYTPDELRQAWEAYKCLLKLYQTLKGLPVGPALLKEAA